MKIISFLSLFLMTSSFCLANLSEGEAAGVLKFIHSQYSLHYGTFQEEYPEQMMSVMYISPYDRVLEIGGNIGRNSCVISSLLVDAKNLVVLESDPGIALGLMTNRDCNGLHFHVENAAISHVPLVQSGWVTVPNSNAVVPAGFFQVKTTTYQALKEKYGIQFNVLVADCEGALYQIFQDDETILNDVELIIVENDYLDKAHYEDVRSKFIAHGFQLIYNRHGGWGVCYNEFYQVWKKPSR